MIVSGTGITAFTAKIGPDYIPATVYALQWIQGANGSWYAVDRGASADIYGVEISLYKDEATINDFIAQVEANREAGSNVLSLSGFNSQEHIFGADVDYSGTITATAAMNRRTQGSWKGFGVTLKLSALSPGFVGTEPLTFPSSGWTFFVMPFAGVAVSSLFSTVPGVIVMDMVNYNLYFPSYPLDEIGTMVQGRQYVACASTAFSIPVFLPTGHVPKLRFLDVGYDADANYTINKLQNYDTSFSYQDHAADDGSFTGTYTFDNAEMQALRRFVASNRGTAFTTPDIIGVANAFGRIAATATVKITYFEDMGMLGMVMGAPRWKAKITLSQCY
jgi:hypothetical protein